MLSENLTHLLSNCWGVLSLFLIPIGGGIPAGVLLAKKVGMDWPMTTVLYFISDVILACCFEPVLLLLIALGKKSEKLRRFSENFSKAMQKTISRYGHNTGPIALVLIAFGVDPMTGRTAAVAAGHKFVAAWSFAIVGDMMYFGILMASTLWLNGILGDGTLTTLIIVAAMIFIPWAVRKFRERNQKELI
jgi:hypothetical protein